VIQPRYLAYAQAHGRTPDEMLAHDRGAWPGGCMTGFMVWVREQWHAWYTETGERPEHGSFASPRQHAALDAWLARRYAAHEQAEMFA